MPRRSAAVTAAITAVAVTGLASLVAFAGVPAAAASAPEGDVFTVTVADSGVPGADGTFRLSCRPAGGTHPKAQAACDRLAELGSGAASGARDPFAPVPRDTMCTMLHGGPATARISGTWRGRAVDASFSKKNGCEISRWRTLEPVLPAAPA
ncbi:SSI family serine proteinase inhibitor [Streptomyces sp. NPDC093109]|uniref:SSI family serine proteinase inhibitor n=1 Tax=Streptomyces sp. NPDC093109 TaxID=3154977 RepID=UPI00344CFC6D